MLAEIDSKRILTAEIQFLRLLAGYALRDGKRNDDFREEMKVYLLEKKNSIVPNANVI